MNFKHIHIGALIKQRVLENEVSTSRISKFLKCTQEEIEMMYQAESLEIKVLLGWSKLLKYDFFRIYSQHLILYNSLSSPSGKKSLSEKQSKLPVFRKSIYTHEIIEFILELIDTGEKDKQQIMQEYKIPKTTLHKWISRNKK